jgi:cytochrome c peroxidase
MQDLPSALRARRHISPTTSGEHRPSGAKRPRSFRFPAREALVPAVQTPENMHVSVSSALRFRTLPAGAVALALALTGGCEFGQPANDGADDPPATDPDGDADSTGDADTNEANTDGADTSGGADTNEGDTSGADTDDGEPVLDLPATLYNYADPDLPAHYRAPLVQDFDNTPVDNAVTDAGATLGRVLFYDTALSQNETRSCASCHQQAFGFSDPETFSEGFAGGLTGRNSMGLADARWYPSGRFFWDERAATLEEQVLGPIQNEVEMGLTLDELVERVADRPYYGDLFAAAFGDETVTSDRIARALAQFVRAMAAYRTRFDVALAGADTLTAPFPGFTPAENLGKQLFFSPQTACAACHVAGPPPGPNGAPPNLAIFQPLRPLNNGLEAGPAADDGVGDISGDPADDGLFKSPSLRNVTVTAPYMHDGRFATLAEVIDHYDSGVQAHPNLDPRLRGPDGQPRRLDLTAEEKAALVAFLGTLTDDALLTDPRFSDPFVR